MIVNPPVGIGVLTTLGDTIYGAAAGVPTRLAGNTTTTKKFWAQTGTGAVSAAPAWSNIVSGDLPLLPLSIGGLGSVLSDPGANKLIGWDDTDNTNGFWALGTGLSYDHASHTLSVSATGLPSQTGNSGKFLTTDGSTASWASVSGGISGSGTDNHLMRWDGTGAAQDSNIVVADTTGAITNSASLSGGNLASFTNTSTGASSTGLYATASGATGATFGIVGTSGSSDNGAYGGYFSRGSANNAALCALGIDVQEMATPSAPPTGFSRIYAKSDSRLYYQSDGGLEVGPLGFQVNITGNAATVTVNANLTGPITSVGNATSIASQTGTGTTFVMSTAPAIAGGSHTALTSLGIRSTSAAFDFTIASSEVLTAGRTLSVVMGDAARILTFTSNATIGGTHSGTSSGTNTGDQTLSGLGGATIALDNLASVAINAALVLATSDGFALGSTTKMWSDLFLAAGAVINFNNGNVTLIHSTGALTLAGALALGVNDLTMTGSLGATGSRLTKGWFTDLQVTNAIAGSVTGNAATVTTNANLTGPVTSIGNATTIADAELAALAGLTSAANKLPYFTGSGTASLADFTPAGFSLTLSANATIGGTNTGDNAANSSSQPLDSDLTTIAGLTATTDNFIVSVASAWASRTPAQAKTTLSLNLVENTALSTWAGTANITTLGTIATGTWSATTIAVNKGGTGTTATLTGLVRGSASAMTASELSGDVSTSGSNAVTIGANKVTLGMLATIAANSVIGNSTGSTATPTAVLLLATATASSISLRDANANLLANNFLGGYTTVTTAAGTTTLVIGSTYEQFFTGTTTQTVTLPVTSTLALGHQFLIVNNSTGLVTVNSSGSNAVVILAGGTSALLTCILTTGTTAASWNATYYGDVVASGKRLTVSNSLTLTATDGSTLAIGAGGTLGSNAYTSTAYAPLASPTFTGTVVIPTPFTIGAVSMTATGTQLNYLAAATGTTGTTSTNLVFSTSPVLTTPNIGAATATSINGNTFTTGTYTLTGTAGKTLNFLKTLSLDGTDGTTMTFPATSATIARTDAANTFSGVQTMTSPALTTPVITGLATGSGVASAATASTLSARDANANLLANNFLEGYTTTVTAAGTTTLSVGSAYAQFFTGTTTQTVKLPVASTLALGHQFLIVNNSTGVVTVQSSGANTIQAMIGLSWMRVTCILASGTDTLSWIANYVPAFASANTVSTAVFRDSSGNFSAGTITAALTGNVTGNVTGSSGTCTGLSGSATVLATARAIYGNNFDGSAALTQIIASTYGGTGNGFAKLSGPTTSEKTFTLPNASATILTDNAAVTAAQGGTGIASYAVGDLLYASGSTTISKLADVAVGSYLRSGGVATAPVWSTLILPNAITAGSVVFGSATNTYGQDNANFFWDDTNDRLGIGTASPGKSLELKSATAALRLTTGSSSFDYGFLISGSTTPQFRSNVSNSYSRMHILPNGTGLSLGGGLFLNSQLIIGNSDLVADAANGASMVLNAMSGTGGFVGIDSQAFGTGTLVPFILSMNGAAAVTVATGGNIVFGAQARLKGYTVAGLPAGTQGDVAFATDLLAPGFLVAAVGGGAVAGPVFYNGATWVAF